MEFYIFCDGASRGNPGPAACAAIVYSDINSDPLLELGKVLGTATNNVAEYRGLLLGLEGLIDFLAESGHSPSDATLHVRMDSELIIRQLTGQYRVKNEALKSLYARVIKLLSRFKSTDLQHVPREKNKAADRLANQYLDNATGT